ncbi:MAG: hypothetical protein B6247_30230 [Candidatus Parabeggiatoa sp. nov. 2]|nr:MAG: hypothetical protein B6247_30230 [Beggiatoa sp. 4572_84]
MILSPAYEKSRNQAMLQGRLETQRVFVKSWLQSRFGEIDKALSQVVESLVQLPPEESTRLLPKLFREELLARFGKKKSQ